MFRKFRNTSGWRAPATLDPYLYETERKMDHAELIERAERHIEALEEIARSEDDRRAGMDAETLRIQIALLRAATDTEGKRPAAPSPPKSLPDEADPDTVAGYLSLKNPL